MNPLDKYRQNYQPPREEDDTPSTPTLVLAYILTLLGFYFFMVFILSM